MVETTVKGYGGEIVVTVGVDGDSTITGINVGGENFSETAGLGALAKEPAFTDQFAGKTVPLKLVKGSAEKGDDTIDAISGATITSTAVNGGVNLAGKFVMDMSGGAASPNTASVQGFAGPVAVTLQVDGAGAITDITIGDAFFNETEGFGAKALEDSFRLQFVGEFKMDALQYLTGQALPAIHRDGHGAKAVVQGNSVFGSEHKTSRERKPFPILS